MKVMCGTRVTLLSFGTREYTRSWSKVFSLCNLSITVLRFRVPIRLYFVVLTIRHVSYWPGKVHSLTKRADIFKKSQYILFTDMLSYTRVSAEAWSLTLLYKVCWVWPFCYRVSGPIYRSLRYFIMHSFHPHISKDFFSRTELTMSWLAAAPLHTSPGHIFASMN